MKIISHNERAGRPVLEYVLVGVLAALFAFGLWIYTKADDLNDDTDEHASQTVTAGTVEEVDALTDDAIDTEIRLEESYDDEEQASGQDMENAADSLGNVYDETDY